MTKAGQESAPVVSWSGASWKSGAELSRMELALLAYGGAHDLRSRRGHHGTGSHRVTRKTTDLFLKHPTQHIAPQKRPHPWIHVLPLCHQHSSYRRLTCIM